MKVVVTDAVTGELVWDAADEIEALVFRDDPQAFMEAPGFALLTGVTIQKHLETKTERVVKPAKVAELALLSGAELEAAVDALTDADYDVIETSRVVAKSVRSVAGNPLMITYTAHTPEKKR